MNKYLLKIILLGLVLSTSGEFSFGAWDPFSTPRAAIFTLSGSDASEDCDSESSSSGSESGSEYEYSSEEEPEEEYIKDRRRRPNFAQDVIKAVFEGQMKYSRDGKLYCPKCGKVIEIDENYKSWVLKKEKWKNGKLVRKARWVKQRADIDHWGIDWHTMVTQMERDHKLQNWFKDEKSKKLFYRNVFNSRIPYNGNYTYLVVMHPSCNRSRSQKTPYKEQLRRIQAIFASGYKFDPRDYTPYRKFRVSDAGMEDFCLPRKLDGEFKRSSQPRKKRTPPDVTPRKHFEEAGRSHRSPPMKRSDRRRTFAPCFSRLPPPSPIRFGRGS